MELENEVLVGILDLLARFGGRLIGSLTILFIGLWAARKLSTLSGKATSKWDLDETGIRFVANIVFYVLFAVVALIAVNNLGVEISAILAALGAAGLAVGLALTGALTNLAAGLVIAVLRPFSIGNHVETCDAEGEVVDIDIFSTTLRTLDNETIVLPNAEVIGGPITNYSTAEFVRVEVPLSVSVNADLDAVTQHLMDAAAACSRVIPEPVPEVQISEFGENAIRLQLEVSVLPVDREDVIFDVNRALGSHYRAGGWAPRKLVQLHEAPSADTL
ncbi:MAG: mechanosensitive ion channel [Rhodothermales bacterium]|nr:mechanosensitive ion channel [Rhodothermales bacterium]MBO6780283.1 mechanosensitive ion channel [Rhodothermales bacterium]